MSELITTSCFHHFSAGVKEKDLPSRSDLGTTHILVHINENNVTSCIYSLELPKDGDHE